MIINHNIAALNTYRQLSNNNVVGNKSLEKLSSGLRINRAGDDAAGLAISEKMRAQIRGLDQAVRNAQDGISLIQTAEGNLNETHSILQRMRELADQAANDTNVKVDRNEIQKEINALTSEINRIGNTTEFNTQKLLDGGASVNEPAIGSNEAVGEAARGAVVQSTNPAGVVTGKFELTGSDSAIVVNGAAFVLNATYNADALALTTAGDLKETAAGLKAALENLATNASGDITLGMVADVSVTDNGVVTITTKGTGANNQIIIQNVAGSSGAAATTLEELGLTAEITHESEFMGSDGTQAVITGQAVDLSQLTADNIQGNKFDVTINGVTTTVTLDDDAVAAGALSGGANPVTSEFSAILQKALDDQIGADLITVGGDADEGYTFTMHKDLIPGGGEQPTLKISGDYASTILGGIDPGQNAIGGTFTAKFQIGANEGQSMQVDIEDMRSQALGIAGTISGGSTDVEGARFTQTLNVTNGTNNDSVEYSLDVSTHESATAAIKVINNAIETVSAERSKLGAYQNRLEHTINNLGTSSENLTAAESRIRDVDMAKEMMEFTKMSILTQAAQAMLAQANQQPQGVLQLLR